MFEFHLFLRYKKIVDCIRLNINPSVLFLLSTKSREEEAFAGEDWLFPGFFIGRFFSPARRRRAREEKTRDLRGIYQLEARLRWVAEDNAERERRCKVAETEKPRRLPVTVTCTAVPRNGL
ncbi:hypothetical protein PUN28_019873 [Cardiocondyla obscurior]|uniref:Uncharacterized protein n=1 Tax=Cardiocondyla obscurior TaxID=286306 RepID=A0AAW2E7X0_9HYME